MQEEAKSFLLPLPPDTCTLFFIVCFVGYLLVKILFITQFYPPEMGAAAARISGLAKGLNKLGHNVTVLTGFPNYPSGIIDEGFRKKAGRWCLIHHGSQDDIIINRVWVFTSPLRNFLTRLLNYFSLVVTSILFGLLDAARYNVVIASSPPLFLGISGYIIAKVKRARFVFDVRDIWPRIGIDTGELKEGSIFVKLAERLETLLYDKSDLITVVTTSKSRRLREKGVPRSRLKVIPNGVDREFLGVKIDHDVMDKYLSPKRFTVVYAGLIGIAQGVEVVVEAANILKDKQDIRFYIIGDGVEKAALVDMANRLSQGNVTFIENQPKEKIATFLKNSDVSIVPLKNDSLMDSVPSKLLESMAMGCPVILSASGESAMIVETAGSGLVTKPGNPAALAKAILRLYNDPELRAQFSKNGIKFIERYFMRDKITKELEAALIESDFKSRRQK